MEMPDSRGSGCAPQRCQGTGARPRRAGAGGEAPHATACFALQRSPSLRALAHLAALLLQAAGPLLLPLPPEHRAGLLVRIRLVRHGGRPTPTTPQASRAALPCPSLAVSQNG